MKLKTILLLLTLLLNMVSVKVMAYDALVDGIYYNFSGTSAEVTYLYNYRSNYNAYKGHVIIPENITYRGKQYSVKSIGSDAFEYCSDLTSITIPSSVASIGEYAFYECTGLASAIIGNSVTTIGNSAFQGCESLKQIVLPNSLTKINMSLFENCTDLESVTIPETVETIENFAFYDCRSLKKLYIPASVNKNWSNCSIT